MSKKIGVVVAFVGLCALTLLLLNCGSSSSRPAGVLYVLTQGTTDQGNPGEGNNVSSFAMDLDSGNLALVNSNASTCPTPATITNTNPCGLPVDILLDPAGAAAFVLDQGAPPCPTCTPGINSPIAPAIYPYTVNSDGSLSAPGTALTWITNTYSDTALAMVRDAAGQFLFVIDEGSFPAPGYPNPTPFASCPHAPTAAYDVCPSISVFAMSGSSTPALAGGSPFYLSKIPTALSAITFTPLGSTTAQEFLFVTNKEDICSQNCIPPSPHNDNTVSVYNVSSSGTLTEQPNSPYAIAAIGPSSVLAVNTNSAGENNAGGLFVYVGQGIGQGAVFPFQVCTASNLTNCPSANYELVPLATCPQVSCDVPASSAGQNPVGMVADPTNSFLYVVSEGSSQVFGFKINATAGTLTTLGPPNLPTGSQPVSMALHPSINNTGQFLYTSNSNSTNITGFTLNTTNGSMSSPITVTAPAAPSGMAVH